MYIYIPLSLALVSIIGIAVIVWRKIPYLKKLDVESMASAGTHMFTWQEFVNDMFPEVVSQKPRFKEFKDLWLVELEKFVRKTRLITLKIDRFSEVVIKKIRRVNRQTPLAVEPVHEIRVEPKTKTTPSQSSAELDVTSLKRREQEFIIQIAKDPKNVALYKELGDLYITLKQWGDAKESFQAAAGLDPNDEDLKEKLSLVLEKMPRTEDTK